jgi:ABC-type transport system involved in cytochrome c biogenesis permease subunit
MRRTAWPALGLAFATALATAIAAPPSSAADKKPTVERFGRGPAYDALAALAVQHEGRNKPLDTLAREELKQIYGREKITFVDDEGEAVATWEPVAAVLDWSARPEYWDNQPILKVEYLPLKRVLLAGAIKEGLSAIAAKPSIAAADREAIEKVVGLEEVGDTDLAGLLRSKTLPEAEARSIARLHAKLGASNKWLTAKELDEARPRVDGRPTTFAAWSDSIQDRMGETRKMTGNDLVLSDLEQAAYDAGITLSRYRQLRDLEYRGGLPVRVVPRPSNPEHVRYSAEQFEAIQSGKLTQDNVTPLQSDVLMLLVSKYKESLQSKEWKAIFSNADSDARYTSWLANSAPWVPVAILLKSDESELAKAGFPSSSLAEFRSAWKRFEDAERSSPGRVDEATAKAVVSAAQRFGTEVNPASYPTPKAMAREVHFNAFGPFWWAPFAYGFGALFLALSLSVQSYRSAVVGSIHRALYWGGIGLFVGGLVLEIYGFALRVLITGWAPVTNMYETVIFVAAVASILGLVLEAVYRRTFAALAGAGIATVCTALAATVPLLDPSIKTLPPVLRSNLWLTIHVLTIVSSYAAFALAMGLGMIATGYYLTATYRRSPSYGELLAPAGIGLPLVVLGVAVREASYGVFSLGQWAVDHGFWPSSVLICFGGVLTIVGVVAALGEMVDRRFVARDLFRRPDPTWDRPVYAADHHEPVAAVAAPTSDGSDDAAEKDPRLAAMRETAAQIKPLANFVYRAMQVGVLLVAAGTILGGVWADYSWGRFWGWDAKEVWALITLLVYLVPLHGRFAGWVNTFGLVMASIVCFLAVLMAWYGVNFVIGVGLHTYGFGHGGGQGGVGMVTLAVLAIAGGAAWRRFLGQRLAMN